MRVINCSTEVSNAQFVAPNRIVFETTDNILNLWDLDKEKSISSWILPKETTHRDISDKLSPNGEYYITLNRNTAIIWELNTGKCVSTLHGHFSTIYSCAFSPNGKYIVTTSHDTQVKVWDWRSGVCVFSRKMKQYRSVQFSPDGNHIALTCPSETKIIDFPSLQQLIDETRERFKSRTIANRKADSGW